MNIETLCTFRCCGAMYAVPAGWACEALDDCSPVPVPLAPWWVAGILAYRGDVLTIVSLRAALGSEVAPAGGTTVLVMEDAHSGERFGVAVDAVEDVITVPREADFEPAAEGSASIAEGLWRHHGTVIIRLSPELLNPDNLQSENWTLLPSELEEPHHAHAYCG